MERSNVEGLNTLLTRSTPQIAAFFDSIDRMLDRIEKLSKKGRPPLNGERYLTDRELSERLKISRRALQDYRSEGKIPYYQDAGTDSTKEQKLFPSLFLLNTNQPFSVSPHV